MLVTDSNKLLYLLDIICRNAVRDGVSEEADVPWKLIVEANAFLLEVYARMRS